MAVYFGFTTGLPVVLHTFLVPKKVNFDEGFNERTGKPKAVNVTGGTGPVGAEGEDQ